MTSPILQFTRKESLCAIQFTSKGKKFKRTCILPMNMNHEAIKEYFATSLYIPIDVVEIVKVEEVYIFYEHIYEDKEYIEGFIDEYWIDVIEYLVEIEQRKSILNFNIVAGMNTNEKDIENIFRSYYPRNKIFVDSFKDGWLMRSKKRYGGKNETITQK
ncbi:hypothetical protein [Enterococcus entomosocium]|uniref:hypothetical protein n=1 Tax=Enterococcus entomosocium TaxID=3034352 RepID=UPI0019295124|nr:hypothetical protein [Enterococcus faecalis]